MKRLFLPICALALVVAGCAGSREEISEDFFPDDSTSTSSTSTTVTPTSVPGDSPGIEEVIDELVGNVSELRQSPPVRPTVEYRPAGDIVAAYAALHGLRRTDNARFDAAYLRMLGVLEEGQDLDDLESYCSIPGFYDPAANVLAIADDVTEFTPLGRRHLVGELTAAATNQTHQWWDTILSARAAGDGEAAVALWALVQGDASFHGEQYAGNVLTSTDRFAITLEQIACDQERDPPSGYVTVLEAFGPDAGRDFVEELIANGGIAEVDAAYTNPPTSSEQMYHPARFIDREAVVGVELDRLSVTGFTEVDTGVFGERMFRALLSEGVTTPQALQAATGWGGDVYRVLWNGTDVVLVLAFEGDRAADARELAETLGGWASASIGVGSGRPDNTGLAFEGEEYAFVAHNGGSMLFVVSNDSKIGRDVRNRFWPTW